MEFGTRRLRDEASEGSQVEYGQRNTCEVEQRKDDVWMCANQGMGMRYETGKSMWKGRT